MSAPKLAEAQRECPSCGERVDHLFYMQTWRAAVCELCGLYEQPVPLTEAGRKAVGR